MPFSSARKWSAVAFAHADPALPGIIALGAPTFLRPSLATGDDGEPAGWAAIEAAAAGWTERGLRVLLVATHADAGALPPHEDEADATLPAGMRALGLVALADELRAEAGAVLASFAAAGVNVKIISGDDPDTVVALARQAGLADAASIAGHELDGLDEADLGKVAEAHTVFGRITPAQKERLVGALKARGHYVAMIGDGVNDVLSLKKADMAIAMGSGSQATRGVADLVLMEDSFAAVAEAVQEGQRILNGMEDILKLFLTRIATVGLVIVSSLVVVTFPIELRNASALTVFTVGIPSALLALWAHPGHQVRDSLDRTLARFVVPAAVVSSLVGLLVFYGVLALSSPDPTALEPARRQRPDGAHVVPRVRGAVPDRVRRAADQVVRRRRAAHRRSPPDLPGDRARARLRRGPAHAAGPRLLPDDRARASRRPDRDPRGRRVGTAGTDLLGVPRRGPVPRAVVNSQRRSTDDAARDRGGDRLRGPRRGRRLLGRGDGLRAARGQRAVRRARPAAARRVPAGRRCCSRRSRSPRSSRTGSTSTCAAT